MTQFAIIVRSMGFGFLTAFLMSLKAMPTTVGYIIKKRQIPIGIDNLANFKESRYCPKLGKNLPSRRPTMMQLAIHKVRYFSKIPSFAFFFSVKTMSDLLYSHFFGDAFFWATCNRNGKFTYLNLSLCAIDSGFFKE